MTVSISNIKSFLIQLFLLLFICLPATLEAKRDADMTIPFQLIHGMIIMDLEVDGVKGAFLLDTGADAILIDGNPTDNTGGEFSTLGGDVAVGTTQLARLQIGSLVQYDVAASVMSLSLLEQNLGIDLFGIIGGAYFMPRSLYMDFTTSTITISDKPFGKKIVKGMSAVKFEMVHGIPVVPVTIGKKIYNFAMDSGASTHFIDGALLEEVEGLRRKATPATVLSANNISTKVSRYELAHFSLGKMTFENQDCLQQNFEDINKELGRPIAGILSLSALAKDKVIIDFKKKKMYF